VFFLFVCLFLFVFFFCFFFRLGSDLGGFGWVPAEN